MFSRQVPLLAILNARPGHAHLRYWSAAGDCNDQSGEAWRCIGCGRIEAPQTCIGVCQDRKVEFVYAFEYEHALAQLTGALTKIDTLQAIGYQLAWTKPRIGEWEYSYRALQQRACKILAWISATSPRLANANQEQS
jgi:hypothetical protein